MKKNRLSELIKQPDLLLKEDYNALKELARERPYFQVIYPLLVKGAKKFETSDVKKLTATAAIYTFDRGNLKLFLTKETAPVTAPTPEPKVTAPVPTTSEKNGTSVTKITYEAPEAGHLPDSFYEEFFHNMQELKGNREHFESAMSDIDEVEEKKPAPKKKASKSKTETTKAKATKTKKKDVKKQSDNDDGNYGIIEEITKKKAKSIRDKHKKEQIDIIDSFISNEPQISKKTGKSKKDKSKEEIEDLSEKSTNLHEDVISETLAKLMLKQGRTEKAIDIYKKLIWKFPQKKSYFASQIEKLKAE